MHAPHLAGSLSHRQQHFILEAKNLAQGNYPYRFTTKGRSWNSTARLAGTPENYAR
jgi:hypothetical protein